MDSASKADMNSYYSRLLRERGSGIGALAYKTAEQQLLRFGLLTSIEPISAHSSVLDVGCGLGHICDYLRERGWKGSYTGIDINPDMVEVGVKRLPDDTLICGDILATAHEGKFTGEFDYVFCGATVQHKPKYGDSLDYLKNMVTTMFGMARKGIAFDVFSTKVDYQDPTALYVDPEYLLNFCYTLSNRLAFRNDFRPYELMVYLYKETGHDDLHIFQQCSSSEPTIV